MNEGEREAAKSLATTALRRASQARERAARARSLAERYEHLAAGHVHTALYARTAGVHRRTEACHESSAQLQESYARRLADGADEADGRRASHLFMSGVAEACEADSVALTIVDSDHRQLAVASSDSFARRAQELEFLLDEGPARDAAVQRRTVVATGPQISARWPGYGPAAAALHINEVVAAPLRTTSACLGALSVFAPRPGRVRAEQFAGVVEALMQIMCLDPDADPDLYGGLNHLATVQQAVGILSVQARCHVNDALSLIKARAFTDDLPIESVAEGIVRGDLKLT